jgi:ElaB/YqjD/DUF883 family membrane-anchored ribosome-binding protein
MNNGENIGANVRRDASMDDPALLERRSDAIRAEMGQTLDALQRNYSPGRLLDRSLDLFKEHGGEIGSNLGRSVKQNPMPLLLTAVGIGWLIYSQSRQQSGASGEYARYDASDDVEDYAATSAASLENTGGAYVASAEYTETSYASDTTATGGSTDDGATGATGATGAVTEKLGAAREKIRGAKDSAMSSVRGGASRVSDTSRRAAERAREQSRRAGQGLQTMLEEQPLVVGALGVALGAIIGAVLPESEREDRMLGQARDRVLDRAKDLGTRGYEQVRSKAQQAASGAREAVQGGGTSAQASEQASEQSSEQAGMQQAVSDLGSAGNTLGSNGSSNPSSRPGL